MTFLTFDFLIANKMRTFEKNVLKNRDNTSNISSTFHASNETTTVIVVMKSIVIEIPC